MYPQLPRPSLPRFVRSGDQMLKYLLKLHLSMAEANSEKRSRIIAMAVDQSEWSEQAFECE